MSNEFFVIMSDREKGIPGAIEDVFPDAIPCYYCQHIANNVQQKFGIKCRPLF
jgi:transposase-like protein